MQDSASIAPDPPYNRPSPGFAVPRVLVPEIFKGAGVPDASASWLAGNDSAKARAACMHTPIPPYTKVGQSWDGGVGQPLDLGISRRLV